MEIRIWQLIIMVPLLTIGACAEVPKEAVTLSVTVGKDLEELRRSHVAATTSLFTRAKQDVNRFIDDVYRPKVIKKFFDTFTMDGRDFIALLSEEMAKPDAGQSIDLMTIVVEESLLQISERRESLLEPVRAQEAAALKAITDAYANVIAGHAVVTAHLASLRKVQETQDEFLADIGLADIRTKVIEKTVKVSNKVGKLMSDARKSGASIDKLEDVIDQAKLAWTKF